MKYKLPISVVIPTMNRIKSLTRTISCLLSKSYIPNQIIIIDQSTSRSDREYIKKYLFKYEYLIDVIYKEQSFASSTKARNDGVSLCKNDIIIFSDDDVDVNDDTLQNLYEFMLDKNIAMVAGINENSKHSNSKWGYLFNTKSYKYRRRGYVTSSMLGRYPEFIVGEVPTMWAMGYFFSIKKSLANKWGVKWDENLKGYAYAEDLDYSFSYFKNAQREELRCLLTDKVKVKHLGSQEYRINNVRRVKMFIINREYLSYKHHMGTLSRIAMRWSNFGYFIYSIIQRQNPIIWISTQYQCDRKRDKIKKGDLRY